jgi:hypothetical protein
VNKPRVEELTYDFVVLTEGHFFPKAEAWEGELGEFDCRLDTGRLTATPNRDFGAPADARAVLEPFLRAWEAHVELSRGVRVDFRYATARVVDLAPDQRGETVRLQAAVEGRATVGADLAVEHDAYPPPSATTFAATPLVAELVRGFGNWVRAGTAPRRRVLVANADRARVWRP